MEKQEFVTFANNIISLDERKKSFSEDIRDAINSFSKRFDMSPKSIKKAVKEYKDYLKSKEEFIEVDSETNQILNTVIYNELNQS